MKLRPLLAALLIGCSLFTRVAAQDAATTPPVPAADPVLDELKALVAKVSAKLKSGSRTAETLAPELAEFDVLLARHTGQNAESLANVAMMKAMLYVQVFKDETMGRELLTKITTNYPGTKPAASAVRILDQLSPEGKARIAAAAAERQAKLGALTGSPAPELHFKWSSKPALKALSDLKGQVVVLDFWATWCGPCIASFPQVREHVAHFKGAPVAFLGVTSIQGYVANMGPRIDTQGDPGREMGLMPDFMKAKEMTWDVVFSAEPVFNPDYGIEGIPFVVIIAPDGTVRHTGLHPGNPAADIAGKINALLKEFNLPVPAKT